MVEKPISHTYRAIPGHWEGDLINGTKNSHIVALVKRHSPVTTLIKVPSKETTVVVAALSRQIRKFPRVPAPIADVDRGHKIAHHKTFSVARM